MGLPLGGNEIQSDARQGEASPIIDLISELGLQSLLPRGTITFFSDYDSHRRPSTIDLVLASEKLANEILRCHVYDQQHGSDHEAIETHFSLQIPRPITEPRLLWKSAP